jgi:hypothetical protein
VNANELADVLEKNPILNPFFTKEAVAMLRQRHIKDITDEEINEVIRIEASKDPAGIGWNLAFNTVRAILRKASEK